ncbi:MAG: peptidoglycan-binding protein [Oscillospiraceae bacterium]|jgi:peptidoglycan hydrolase-like protein with peptidoglycan-binding domain|nr:peptidoglycan-binding protein [Oscillospiraceae bacterium]
MADTGLLKIGLFAKEKGIPVKGASVKISESGSGNVIDELITDESGEAGTVFLNAPPLEYSMSPGQPTPYSEYDVAVTAEGYEPTTVRGVQILSDTEAIQDISMLPLSGNETDEIIIEDNVLAGDYPPKIPESEVKPLAGAEGFVVLPEPVIPEYIVVHTGTPSNTAAKDYWVPFKDYVKNVASCEIYSTWPNSTIRANVLAIISFVLNRVYTEWYRSKGYNFTITNSTSFDLAYNHGRNIFQEISIVVDEIFTNYITKPNIRQPLLTQFCDGRMVTCPGWMTQWGSKALGDQGYSATDILKNFYGYDIYLTSAKIVEGTPSSYPGTPLQVGSSGANVRTIQEQLNAIANNYPAIGKMKVDGIFGQNTKAAVQKFQNIFNLGQSGMVDFATWYKISNIFVAVSKIAELR